MDRKIIEKISVGYKNITYLCSIIIKTKEYAYNFNSMSKDLKLAESIIEENKELIVTEWIKIYGNKNS
jgi:hypothetical protein